MARRVVESAPLRGRDACARLRVFAIDELTGRDSYEARRRRVAKFKKVDAIARRPPESRARARPFSDVCVGNARPEH